jgi:hypothetical protein
MGRSREGGKGADKTLGQELGEERIPIRRVEVKTVKYRKAPLNLVMRKSLVGWPPVLFYYGSPGKLTCLFTLDR